MRILVVGGTRFVGRHLVAAAVERGHEVTVLHRGNTCAGAPDAEHLHADRDGDLSLLGAGRWDATIDTCAYYPRQVDSLADALDGRGGRHLLVSTVSVYADPPGRGMAEEAPLQPALGMDGEPRAVTPATYGGLKVGCEQAATRRYGDRLMTVRPTYLIGPHDHTGRFPAWVARVARGGDVLAPGAREAPLEYLDARDLAALCMTLIEGQATGTIHTMAPPTTWGDLLDTLVRTVAPDPTTVTWASSEWLTEHSVTPSDLPLWTGSDEEPAFTLDPARALAAGLTPRPLAETIADTWAWLTDPEIPDPPQRLGMERGREALLVAEVRAGQTVE